MANNQNDVTVTVNAKFDEIKKLKKELTEIIAKFKETQETFKRKGWGSTQELKNFEAITENVAKTLQKVNKQIRDFESNNNFTVNTQRRVDALNRSIASLSQSLSMMKQQQSVGESIMENAILSSDKEFEKKIIRTIKAKERAAERELKRKERASERAEISAERDALREKKEKSDIFKDLATYRKKQDKEVSDEDYKEYKAKLARELELEKLTIDKVNEFHKKALKENIDYDRRVKGTTFLSSKWLPGTSPLGTKISRKQKDIEGGGSYADLVNDYKLRQKNYLTELKKSLAEERRIFNQDHKEALADNKKFDEDLLQSKKLNAAMGSEWYPGKLKNVPKLTKEQTKKVIEIPEVEQVRKVFNYAEWSKQTNDSINFQKDKLNQLREALKKVSVEGGSNIKEYTSQLKREIRGTESVLEGHARGWKNLSNSIIGNMANMFKMQMQWYTAKAFIFAPLEKIKKEAVSFLNWEQALKDVKAASGATDEELKKLAETTKQVGATTIVSAEKSATAMFDFAQAGMPVYQIEKALPIAAKLVTITHEDMGEAVMALSKISNTWVKDATNMSKVGDMLAASMADSRLKITDLKTVLNYLGQQASSSNMNLQTTLTLVTALSQAGAEPSTIGTGLSGFISRFYNLDSKKRANLKSILEPKLKAAGMSIKDVLMPENDVITVIKNLNKAKINIIDFFDGLEMRIGRTANSLNNMASKLDSIYKNIGTPDKLNTMYDISMAGMKDRLQKLLNEISNEFKSLIVVLEPSINKIINLLGSLLVPIGKVKETLIGLITILGSMLAVRLTQYIIPSIIMLITQLKLWVESVVLAISMGSRLSISLGGLASRFDLLGVAIGGSLFLIYEVIKALKDLDQANNDAAKGIDIDWSNMSQKRIKAYAEQYDSEILDLEKKIKDKKQQNKKSSSSYEGYSGESVDVTGAWKIFGEDQDLKRMEASLNSLKSSKAKAMIALNSRIAEDKKNEQLLRTTPPPSNKGNATAQLKEAFNAEKALMDAKLKLINLNIEYEIDLEKEKLDTNLINEEEFQIKKSQIYKNYEQKRLDINNKLQEFAKTDLLSVFNDSYSKAKTDIERENLKTRYDADLAIIEAQGKKEENSILKQNLDTNRELIKLTNERLLKESKLAIDEKLNEQKTILDLEQQKVSREETLNKWLYDNNLISTKKFYEEEEKLILKNKKLKEDLLDAEIESEIDYQAEIFTIYNGISEKAEDAYRQITLLRERQNREILKIEEDTKTQLINKELEKATNIKMLWQSEEGPLKVIGKALLDSSKDWKTFGENIYELIKGLASGLSSTFETMFFDTMQGKLNSLLDYWNSFANSVQKIIAKMMSDMMMMNIFGVNPQSGEISGGIAGFFKNLLTPSGASSSSLSGNWATEFSGGGGFNPFSSGHTGGVFTNKGFRRLHVGGLLADEEMIIGQSGEGILSRKGMETLGKLNSGSISSNTNSAPKITFNVTNKTGVEAEAEQGSTSFDGNEYICNVILKKTQSSRTYRNALFGGNK